MKKRILSFFIVLLIFVSVFPVSIFATEKDSTEEIIADLSKTSIEEDFENVFKGQVIRNLKDYEG